MAQPHAWISSFTSSTHGGSKNFSSGYLEMCQLYHVFSYTAVYGITARLLPGYGLIALEVYKGIQLVVVLCRGYGLERFKLRLRTEDLRVL